MGAHLFEAARKSNVEKLISVGTICSYPKFTPVPFSESDIWNGYPEETNAPYGLAKKMLLVQSQAYRQQYNFKSITMFPTNLYGPNDNFQEIKSHVIPALIKKVYFAKKNNLHSIDLWGDGSPTRDFMYVDDAAEGIVTAAEKYDKSEHVNLGTGKETSIKELIDLLFKLMNANLKINWQKEKPNGQPRRCINTTKAYEEFGFRPKVSFEEGLRRTIEWYENSQKHLTISS